MSFGNMSQIPDKHVTNVQAARFFLISPAREHSRSNTVEGHSGEPSLQWNENDRKNKKAEDDLQAHGCRRDLVSHQCGLDGIGKRLRWTGLLADGPLASKSFARKVTSPVGK